MEPHWLDWGRRLQAIAHNGLIWAANPFDRARYEQVRSLAAELLAAHSGEPPERISGLFAADAGYATPKVDVRGVVFDRGRVLLVRERSDGRWTLPGGWADVGDAPSEAVTREVAEEAGYRTRAVKLLACWDRARHRHAPPLPFRAYKLFFACELLDPPGTPAAPDGVETDGVDWFGERKLPTLSLGRVTPEQLSVLFAHDRDPRRPADFD